jgi:hypothetical protein
MRSPRATTPAGCGRAAGRCRRRRAFLPSASRTQRRDRPHAEVGDPLAVGRQDRVKRAGHDRLGHLDLAPCEGEQPHLTVLLSEVTGIVRCMPLPEATRRCRHRATKRPLARACRHHRAGDGREEDGGNARNSPVRISEVYATATPHGNTIKRPLRRSGLEKFALRQGPPTVVAAAVGVSVGAVEGGRAVAVGVAVTSAAELYRPRAFATTG